MLTKVEGKGTQTGPVWKKETALAGRVLLLEDAGALLFKAHLPQSEIPSNYSGITSGMYLLSVWDQLIIFFYFRFYAWFGMLSKDMGESFLLSKDEPLTPNIDGVMALWIFRRRAQTA